MEITVALAGNPNSGKTTLFNLLTGSRQRVGNYPGITVEKREGFLEYKGAKIHVIDLPGTYSLTAYSQEELVARNFLVEEKPDIVIHVADATNLERNLYLTIQLLELGVPLILVLNMMDEVPKRGIYINSKKLSELLGIPIVEMVAREGKGKRELLEAVVNYEKKNIEPLNISYGSDLDEALEKMEKIIKENKFLSKYPPKWIALKYLEEDDEIKWLGKKENEVVASQLENIASNVSEHCEKTLNTYPEAIIADFRYGFITSLLKQDVLKRFGNQNRIDISEKLDRILTHRLFGPIIMLFVLYSLFFITFRLGELPLEWMNNLFEWLGKLFSSILPPGVFRSLIVSGIIGGVGGVLSFFPLILIMFFCLSFLEDSGYMARIAYMLDRVLRSFGLHGSSVMPFILSGGIPGGCAVPGILATRTLRSPKEKLATLLTVPFMACGAKVPVFLVIVGAFFPKHPEEVLFWITIFGWFCALMVAKLLRSTIIKGEPTPFVMELPPYRMPTLQGMIIHSWERGWQYIKKAGTVILAISVIIWAAINYPKPPKKIVNEFDKKIKELSSRIKKEPSTLKELELLKREREELFIKYSLAGRIGLFLEPISKLAGFDWKINVALLGGIAAKEVIVSTMGTVYSLKGDEKGLSLSEKIAKDPNWNILKSISLLVFVLLYSPCFVSIVTISKETSWKWGVFSLIFNTAFAYILSVLIFQLGQKI